MITYRGCTQPVAKWAKHLPRRRIAGRTWAWIGTVHLPLEVVDGNGRPRIYLSTLRGWLEIKILDTAGHSRMAMSIDPGEWTPMLSLVGRNPRNSVVLMPARLMVGDMTGDQVSLTMQGLKRFVRGPCKNCPDQAIWSVP